MQRLRILTAVLSLCLLSLSASGFSAQESTQEVPFNMTSPGTSFPALKVKVLKPGASDLSPLDLGTVLGTKPIVFVYFLLGEGISEEVFLDVQNLAERELEKKVAVYGVIKLGRRYSLESAVERLSLFGASVPVIVETDLLLANHLGIKTAPSISLIDENGIYKIPDAKSLKQEIVRGINMKKAIQNAARGGPVPQSLRLPRYYPAEELVGEPFPDFMLKQFKSDKRLKLSDVVQEDRVTALLFWHPNCKQCKTAMPGIVTGSRSYKDWMDVISVTSLADADEEQNASDVIRVHEMEFPVLVDEGKRVKDLYKVLSTPTMFFIRPDGIIDSVYTQGDANYVPIMSVRIRRILKVGVEYGKMP